MLSIAIRHMEESDFDSLVEISQNDSTYHDPDFEDLAGPWLMDRADFLGVIRQRKDDTRGTFDTRVYVTETISTDDEGHEVRWVCGGFALELQPLGWEILYLVMDKSLYAYDPAANFGRGAEKGGVLDVLECIADFAQEKASRSERRKSVSIVLWDRDEAHLRSLLPFWVRREFEVKLKRDYFLGNIDGWVCTWTAAAGEAKRAQPEPMAA